MSVMDETASENPPVTLADILHPGFNYEAFVQAIEQEEQLTDKQKTAVCKRLNPQAEIGPEIRSEEDFDTHLLYGYIDPPTRMDPLPKDHPSQVVFDEAWKEVAKHYEKEIERYNRKANTKFGLFSYPPFEIRKPTLLTYENPFVYASARMDAAFSNVEVSTGFLDLPLKTQKAVLVHELAHHMEPALTPGLPGPGLFSIKTKGKAALTLNASNRKRENNADDLAGKLGYGDTLATFLSTRKQLEDQVEKDVVIIADHALASGFAVDEQKLAELIEKRKGNDRDGQKRSEKLKTTLKKTEIVTAPAKSFLKRIAPAHPSDEKRIGRLEKWSDAAQPPGQLSSSRSRS